MKKATRCKVEGCQQKAVASGWCHTHYMRVYRTGEAGPAGPLPSGQPAFLTVCKIDGCGQKALAKDLCRKHYARVVRTGVTDDPVPTPEFCSVDGCGKKFYSLGLCRLHYWRKKVTGDVGPAKAMDRKRVHVDSDGCVVCNTCGTRKHLEQFPTRGDGRLFGSCKVCRMKQQQIRRHGFCVVENSQCAICESKKRLHVDHDHKTEKARDILCGKCNAGLGYFDDSPARLRAAATYLDSHV